MRFIPFELKLTGRIVYVNPALVSNIAEDTQKDNVCHIDVGNDSYPVVGPASRVVGILESAIRREEK